MIDPDRIAELGVVGAGGAGFPTHVKLKATADSVLINAAECEPLLHKDKEVLKAYPSEVLGGLQTAMRSVGAESGFLGIKGKYEEVITVLEPLVPPEIHIVPLTDTYPAGDEFILVYDVLDRIIPPGGIPLDVGAIVINVETALNIALAKPVTHKFLTVAGAVAEPITIRVPIGISFGEVIDMAGGPLIDDYRVLEGGVMMGKLADSTDKQVTKTTGGLIVLPSEHPVLHRYTDSWEVIHRVGASACDQCNFCTELCPRYLLGHPIEPHKAMRSLMFNLVGEPNVIGTNFCCECNLCTMYACPEDLDPKNVCSTNKRQLIEANRKWEVDAHPTRASNHLNNRRAPLSRLIRKLGLSKFRNQGPLVEVTRQPKRVLLPLKQHVGAPAEPIVQVGARVSEGDVLGRPPPGKLGAAIHASIAGRVTEINESVAIEAN
jgi:Na+-translocating ferredoxin:NAD+ oxidoreductase RnfC subunit